MDGSFRQEDGSAGAGMILRDHLGQVIFAACRFLPWCNDPLEAELAACEEGLSLAQQWSDLPIALESDCAEALPS